MSVQIFLIWTPKVSTSTFHICSEWTTQYSNQTFSTKFQSATKRSNWSKNPNCCYFAYQYSPWSVRSRWDTRKRGRRRRRRASSPSCRPPRAAARSCRSAATTRRRYPWSVAASMSESKRCESKRNRAHVHILGNMGDTNSNGPWVIVNRLFTRIWRVVTKLCDTYYLLVCYSTPSIGSHRTQSISPAHTEKSLSQVHTGRLRERAVSFVIRGRRRVCVQLKKHKRTQTQRKRCFQERGVVFPIFLMGYAVSSVKLMKVSSCRKKTKNPSHDSVKLRRTRSGV